MILSPKSPFSRALPLQRGFTLIEVLVACAVLMLIVAMLFQMMNMMSKTWVAGRAQAETSVTARALLDVIAEDIGASVSRTDLPAFRDASGQPALIFYTQRQGISTGTAPVRPLSMVSYDTTSFLNNTNASLIRSDLSQAWSTPPFEMDGKLTNAGNLTAPTTDTNEIGTGIIAFDFAFMAANQSLTTNYYPSNPNDYSYTNTGNSTYNKTTNLVSRAVVVSVAVVDAKTLGILNSTGKLTNLQNFFSTLQGASPDTLANWQTAIEKGQLAQYGMPSALAANLLILERTIPLPIQK
jgi:prepilin-type N-terminal cleavage/methylation domain-containing protein